MDETTPLQQPKPFPSQRRQDEKRAQAVKYNLARLLFVLFLERVAFYTIFYDLTNFSSKMLNLRSSWAAAILDVFHGTAYFFPVLFGALSDRKLGYYPTLVGAFTVSPIATGGICYLAYYTERENQASDKTNAVCAYVACLAVFALCAAAINANLMPYMLEQMGEENKNRHRLVSYFWSIAYVAINIGGTVGILASLLKGYGRVWTYLFAPVALFSALLTLLFWRKDFKSHSFESRAEYWPNVFSILATGFGCYREKYSPPYYDQTDLPLRNKEEVKRYERDEHRKRLAVLVPVLATLLAYYTIYSQMSNSFTEQAQTVNVYSDQTEIGSYDSNSTVNCTNTTSKNFSYKFPIVLLNVVDMVGVLIAIPIMWFIVRPLYERVLRKEINILTKMRWGMVIAFLAITSALVVDIVGHYHEQNPVHLAYTCLSNANANATTYIIEAIPYSASLHITSLIPQFLLVGFSEACTLIGAIEFVLSRAPREYRCTAYGFNYAVQGLASYFSAILIYVFSDNHLYFRTIKRSSSVANVVVQKVHRPLTWIYYLSIAVMMLISILIFSCVKRRHQDIVRKYRELMHK